MSGQPHPDRVRLLPWTPPALVADTILIVLLVTFWATRAVAQDLRLDLAVETGATVAAVAVIGLRRRFPVPALALGVAVTCLIAVTSQPSVIMPATLVAMFEVAGRRPWRGALAAGAVTVSVFALVVVLFVEPGRLAGGLLAAIAWPAFATAAGVAVRASRESLAAATERAARAEADQDREARRQVVEERLRIARDVHDVVAHHLAVVNVQTGVAAHLLDTDTAAATTALDTARTAASTAIGELGDLLGVLRDPDAASGPGDDAGPGTDRPTPDLAAIDDLIASFGASGLKVRHDQRGTPRPLAPSAEIAAYRFVQEALTNAHKHGDGAASVAQHFEPAHLTIEISNRPAGGRHGGGTGHGLIGMRERVEATGGRLRIDETPDRFVVRAELPTRREDP